MLKAGCAGRMLARGLSFWALNGCVVPSSHSMLTDQSEIPCMLCLEAAVEPVYVQRPERDFIPPSQEGQVSRQIPACALWWHSLKDFIKARRSPAPNIIGLKQQCWINQHYTLNPCHDLRWTRWVQKLDFSSFPFHTLISIFVLKSSYKARLCGSGYVGERGRVGGGLNSVMLAGHFCMNRVNSVLLQSSLFI